MKLNQIFLILSITLILQLSARHVQNQTLQGKTKAKQNTKGLWDILFSDWNKASFTIHGQKQLGFDCEIRDAQLDDQPLGIAFNGFKQNTHNDESGFMSYAVGFHKIQGQVLPMPILDFRLIQNCLFTDSVNGWGFWKDYILTFDVVSNEHQKLSWNVEMKLPSLGEDATKTLKQKLNGLCQARNKQINTLRDTAIKSGNNYATQWQLGQSRIVSLNTQSNLGDKKAKLIEKVQEEQTTVGIQYKYQIEQNEIILKQSMDKLHKSAISSQCTESEIEVFYKQIAEIKETLSVLETNQTIIKTNIDNSQQDLSEALKLQEEKTETAETIAKKKYEQEIKNKEDKLEFDRLFMETQAKMLKMQEDYAIKKQQQQNKIQLLNSQQAQTTLETEKLNMNIEQLQLQIEGQTESVKSIDSQTFMTLQQLFLIEGKLNEKISISQKFDLEEKLQKEMIIQQTLKITLIRTESTKRIESLKKKEIEQIKLLKKTEKEEQVLIDDANKAEKKLLEDRTQFDKDLQNIVNAADPTEVKTVKAWSSALIGRSISVLNEIVSNSQDQMKQSQMRFQKQEKQFELIAKYRFQQMHQVRLMRNKLKSKIQQKLRRQ